jgi:hypothetical protein
VGVSVPVVYSIDRNGGKMQMHLVLTFMEKIVAYEQVITMAEFRIKGII